MIVYIRELLTQIIYIYVFFLTKDDQCAHSSPIFQAYVSMNTNVLYSFEDTYIIHGKRSLSLCIYNTVMWIYDDGAGFYTKGRPLVKSNLICPSDKLTWQPGCPVLNINIQGNFCISPGNGSSDNLPENLV